MLNEMRKNEEGFVSIIALIIMFVLTIVGLQIQRTTIDTVNNIKASNNYYRAQDIANSAMEMLQFDLRSHEAGYNKNINCTYGEGGGYG
jgi:Tfp pilus assembly protein PilX